MQSFLKSQQLSTALHNPAIFLMALAATMQLGFASWHSLNYNFAVETLSFTGREIGIQQSVREIPGFLSFAAVIFLFWFREQTFAYISLLLLGAAGALTGYFPSFWGFLIITFVSSVGFHYYETMAQSLQLQLLPKATAPSIMGKILAVGAFSQLVAFSIVFVSWHIFDLGYTYVFLITGGLTVIAVLAMYMLFPKHQGEFVQRKELVLRKRYWLYYALTFMGGARRQIFVVFAVLLMVERFEFEVHEVAGLFFANGLINMLLAPQIGKFINHVGERRALTYEYIGLIIIFTAYAFAPNIWIVIALYILDHAFFAMAIAMRTYFQKIADPSDIAPTAGVAFTINHIAAVFIPVIFGLIWLWSPAAVFISGAAMSGISLIMARMVPIAPQPGKEFRWLESGRPSAVTSS